VLRGGGLGIWVREVYGGAESRGAATRAMGSTSNGGDFIGFGELGTHPAAASRLGGAGCVNCLQVWDEIHN
jgi:hypothetical protein